MIVPIWDGVDWVLTKPTQGSVYTLTLLEERRKALSHAIATARTSIALKVATRQLAITEQQILALS